MQDRYSDRQGEVASRSQSLGRQRWLVVGAAAGLAVALASVARPGDGDWPLPASDVALVNGEAVRADALQRAVAMVTSDRGVSADRVDPREILERLIDEELLVQRALELDFARSDVSVRRAAVRAVIDSVVLDAESSEIGEGELRAYFESNPGLFARPATAEVERVVVRDRGDGDDPAARAAAVARLLRAGAAVDYVRGAHGDEAVAPMPAGPLLLTELREHVGPAAAKAVSESSAGDVVGPIETNATLVVLRVRALSGAIASDFSASHELVTAAYRKERVDEAVRSYLRRLRDRSSIVVNEAVLGDTQSR